jgi:hypothetical protein
MNLQPIGAREKVFGMSLHPEFVGREQLEIGMREILHPVAGREAESDHEH